MGQLGANLGNANVTNPQQAKWGDLDQNERAARVIGGGTQGLSKGFQNYQNQNMAMRQGGGFGFSPIAQQQQVDPSYFQPQQQRPNNLAFYGGY